MKTPIKKGDRVYIRPEWQDDGDDKIVFIAVEDEDGGRVRVEALCGLTFNPQETIHLDMLCEEPRA